MSTALVVSTYRADQLQPWIDAWTPYADWDILIVVENAPCKSIQLPDSILHYSWQEITEHMGEKAWIIAKNNTASKSFGFLMAYQLGCEYVCTIQDTCLPWPDSRNDMTGPFLARHRAAMANHRRWTSTAPDVRQRGLPHRNVGRLNSVICNVGSWAGTPDQDACQTVLSPIDDYIPRPGSYLVPAGQYIPVSGLNLCFIGEAAPLFYMQEGSFADIKCGIIAKRIIDHLGCHLSVGEPHVYNQSSSNPFTRLSQEANEIAAGETFWELIDGLEFAGTTPLECMSALGQELAHHHKYGEAILIWADLLAGRDKA